MPDSGVGGFYTDWYNNGAGGNPRWESYHIGQLLPWIDANYRTVPGRSGHAVAGLSMGGFGAMSYAARHPDLFVSAAAFSGVVDSNTPAVVGAEFDENLSFLDGGSPGSLWGARATDEVRRRAHNPWDLAANLRGLRLELHTGDGTPGPYNSTPDSLEGGVVHPQNVSLHQRFDDLGIPHVWDDSPGSHAWQYWQRDLDRYLPNLMATFADPPAPPSPFTFTAAEPDFAAYSYHVHMTRAAMEFATLDGVTPAGFRLTGSGSADITTAPIYRPNNNYQVTITGPNQSTTLTITADRIGQLTIPLLLGPANPNQQYTTQAVAAGESFYTATVAITRVI